MVVVDAAGQRFLLGVTEHAVNVLHTGDIPAEAEEVAGSGNPPRSRRIRPDPVRLRPASPAGSPACEELRRRRQRRLCRLRPPGTPRCPAAAPCTGTPTRADPRCAATRRRCRPPAPARFDPCRLHVEAGRRRSQERTPQLTPARSPSGATALRERPRLPSDRLRRPGPGPCRRPVRGAAAVAERLGRPRRPDRPDPAGRRRPTRRTPAAGTSTSRSTDSTANRRTAVLTLIGITLLSVAPALLLMMTSFTKIFVVLAMTRNALSLPSIPPNQVLAGLALFLSIFVMWPGLNEMNTLGDPALPQRHPGLQRGRRRRHPARCSSSCSPTPGKRTSP